MKTVAKGGAALCLCAAYAASWDPGILSPLILSSSRQKACSSDELQVSEGGGISDFPIFQFPSAQSPSSPLAPLCSYLASQALPSQRCLLKGRVCFHGAEDGLGFQQQQIENVEENMEEGRPGLGVKRTNEKHRNPSRPACQRCRCGRGRGSRWVCSVVGLVTGQLEEELESCPWQHSNLVVSVYAHS